MTHLPFVAGSYAALGLVALALSVGAAVRLRTARARLAALEGPAAATGPGVRR